MNGTLTNTVTLGQSEYGNKGNEGVLHTPRNYWKGASPSGAV